jgi:hypothetical protein
MPFSTDGEREANSRDLRLIDFRVPAAVTGQ